MNENCKEEKILSTKFLFVVEEKGERKERINNVERWFIGLWFVVQFHSVVQGT